MYWRRVSWEAYLSGDINLGTIACGQVVGRIHEVKSVQETVDDIINEAEHIIGRLNTLSGK